MCGPLSTSVLFLLPPHCKELCVIISMENSLIPTPCPQALFDCDGAGVSELKLMPCVQK